MPSVVKETTPYYCPLIEKGRGGRLSMPCNRKGSGGGGGEAFKAV